MPAGLGADRSESAELGAVALHVFTARAAELTKGHRYTNRAGVGGQLVRYLQMLAHARRSVGKNRAQGTWLHLLETQGQSAFDRPAFHCLASQVQGRGASGTVVVDVHHRHTTHAHFIERRLTAGRVAIDISDISLLYQMVVQACVFQGLASRFSAHLDI
ncbi:hypothetical protein D3C85_1378360 [compost metagenome]